IHALIRLIRAPNAFDGASRLIEAYGIGALTPNTILLGDTESEANLPDYCNMIAGFHEARRNVVILHHDAERDFGDRKRIDVWWGGLESNGGLMLTLAYLLQTSVEWRGAELRVHMIVPNQAAADSALPKLERIVGGLRTESSCRTIPADGRPFEEIFREASVGADCVFIGMREPDPEWEDYYRRVQKLVIGMPTTALVLAAEELAFSEILVKPEG
ncbi:MAG: Na-K-Cl cotransporter, partial [Gemmatimonadota bacterium]